MPSCTVSIAWKAASKCQSCRLLSLCSEQIVKGQVQHVLRAYCEIKCSPETFMCEEEKAALDYEGSEA